MNTYQKYQTDPDAEESGAQVEFSEGMVINVRSTRSKSVRDQQAVINRRNQRFYRTGAAVPTEILDKDNVDLTVAIISGWTGVTGPEGETLSYSEANVRRVMTDLSDLRDQVIAASAMSETFRKEALKAAKGNLSPASALSSTSAAPGAQGS